MTRHWSETTLRAVIASTIIFGLLSMLSAVPALEWPARFFTDFMIWPLDGTQSVQAPETRLIWALLGGFLTSWGVLQWQILTKIGPSDRTLARNLIIQSVVVWFVLDTTGSFVGGVPVNGVANVFFFTIYMIPLLAMPTEARTRLAR